MSPAVLRLVPAPEDGPVQRRLRCIEGWDAGLRLPWTWATPTYTQQRQRLYIAVHPDGRTTPPSQSVLQACAYTDRLDRGESLDAPPAAHGASSPIVHEEPAPRPQLQLLPRPDDGQLSMF